MAKAQYNARRQFLKTIPAIAAAGIATPALAEAETPVMRAYREWLAFRNWLHSSTADMPDQVFDGLCDDRLALERAMFEIPSQNLQDATLKLLAFTDNGNDFSDDGRETGARLVREIKDFAA